LRPYRGMHTFVFGMLPDCPQFEVVGWLPSPKTCTRSSSVLTALYQVTALERHCGESHGASDCRDRAQLSAAAQGITTYEVWPALFSQSVSAALDSRSLSVFGDTRFLCVVVSTAARLRTPLVCSLLGGRWVGQCWLCDLL
jgi:hypothetical protein